jgi:peptide/nickel transport system substrate-binding protein
MALKKYLGILGLVTIAMVLVAACGADEGEAEATSPAGAAATATSPPAATAPPSATQPPAATAEPTPYKPPAGTTSFIYTGPIPTSFSEAPILAAKVASGELPPVEERIPAEDFFTMQVVDSIGEYGGTWRRAFTGPNDSENQNRITPDYLYLWDMNGVDTYPFFMKGGESNDDETVFTYFLREDMKWSDGEIYDANDIAFAYFDVNTNEDLNPGVEGALGVTSFAPTFEMVDDLTVRYTFDEPTPAFGDAVASSGIGGLYIWGAVGKAPMYPEHYAKQFHIKYGDKDEIDKLTEDGAFDSWGQMWLETMNMHRNTEAPCLGAWCTTVPQTGITWEMERNPYFFAVDPEGNQLPYIDAIKMQLTETAEVLNLKAMAGEIDYQQRHIMLDKLPVLKENEEKGNYVTHLNISLSGAGVMFNQTWGGAIDDGEGDDEVEKWIRTKEFRQALSMGLRRQDFDTIFLGLGEFRHPAPTEDHPFYLGPGWDEKYIDFDADTANQMLDDLGLDQKDAEGWRLRTDGEGPLILEVSFVTAYFQNFEAMSELVESHWEDNLGIQVILAPKDVSVYGEHRRSNKNQVFVGGVTTVGTQPNDPSSMTSDLSPLVADWYATDGVDGVEPTDSLKRLTEIYNATFPLRMIDRKDLYIEGFKIQLEEMYMVTFKSGYPGFMGVLVKKNNFKNHPPDCVCIDHIPAEQHPEQFYFEGGKNDAGF